MGSGESPSLYLLPAITGRCVEPVPRPVKLPQRSNLGQLHRPSGRTPTKQGFSCSKEETRKVEDSESEVIQGSGSSSPEVRSTSVRSASVLPLTDSWSTPSLSESSEPRTLRPFSATSARPDGCGTPGQIQQSTVGLERLCLVSKEPKRRRRAGRIKTHKSNSASAPDVKALSRSREPPTTKQFYVVQFGNNSGVLRDLLKHRRIWFPGPGDPGYEKGRRLEPPCSLKPEAAVDAPEIQLLWSQYVVRDFLNVMAEDQQGWLVSHNDETRIRLERREMSAPAGAQPSPSLRVHNHFERNALISSKAGLRETMVSYYLALGRDPFGAIPLTFVVHGGSDPEFGKWQETFEEFGEKGQTVWLVKPGDKANQGKGIVVCDSVEEVREAVDSKNRTWVIQKYIERPFLIHKRKFDIRSYCLLAQDPATGVLNGYFYREAYLRTTSTNFTLSSKDRFVHLNNDAVQKHGAGYGKFEDANKMSLSEFQNYLDGHHGRECLSVPGDLMPQMRALMTDTLRAVGTKINPRGLQHCFEVFGFDFMVDEGFRTWLIEVNTNPSLDPCCPLLRSMIPKMLDEALSLSLDKIFATGKPAHLTAWEPIYSSDAPVQEVCCAWLPPLPSDGPACDVSALGRGILTPPTLRGKKGSKAATEGRGGS